ncbi:alpha/beta hydrolase [Verrucomicrobium sp. GAS474]|uniref:alpha/beta hydrolase n=1 Tax=Verrucomicrobium sp. GAS474 TaxID=1882831 RepID=UPI000B88689D|nr:alpha/beta hydrolase [Verrucomicrobium sp. GAS474]
MASLTAPFPIWTTVPGSLGSGDLHEPKLTPFPAWGGKRADGAAHPAFLVLPGGGYGTHAGHEGQGYAEWFARNGISAFVLNYRLGSTGYRHPAMLDDAARALRTLRANAAALGIDPGKIGVIGSSAGGHLASTLLTKWTAGDATAADPVERVSSRPDVGILCYPVISFVESFTHVGSRTNLLGPDAPESLWRELSAEKQVTPRTPPTFLWHTVEDAPVPVENSIAFASALRAQGVPFALHVYEKGAHGLGLANHAWAPQALRWLATRWPLFPWLDG